MSDPHPVRKEKISDWRVQPRVRPGRETTPWVDFFAVDRNGIQPRRKISSGMSYDMDGSPSVILNWGSGENTTYLPLPPGNQGAGLLALYLTLLIRERGIDRFS